MFVCLCIDVSAQWGDGGCQRDLYRSYKVSYHLSSLLWYMYLLIIILRQAQDEINELKCELSMRHSEIAVLEERCPSFLVHTTLHVPGHSLTYPATHSLIHPTTHPLTHSYTQPPTHSLTHTPNHPPTHSFTHTTHSPNHPLTHSLTPLTHSLTQPPTHSLIHSHHSLTDSSTLFLSRLATTIAAKEMSESVCEGLRHSHTHLQQQYTTALDHFETALKEKDEVRNGNWYTCFMLVWVAMWVKFYLTQNVYLVHRLYVIITCPGSARYTWPAATCLLFVGGSSV